jgi:hypothetical protein
MPTSETIQPEGRLKGNAPRRQVANRSHHCGLRYRSFEQLERRELLSTLFADDFNDNVIDPGRWPADGVGVADGPRSGALEYYIDGVKQMELAVGSVPNGAPVQLELFFGAWGWWTGHEQHMDDLVVTQNIEEGCGPVGQIEFTPSVQTEVAQGPHTVKAGDLDTDGDLDLVVMNQYANSVSVLLNNGDGSFVAGQNHAVGENPLAMEVADLDGDRDLDLVVANETSDDVSILLNDGNGSFSPLGNIAAGDSPQSLATADYDGDGDIDVAVAHVLGGDVAILGNSGDGSFSDAIHYSVGASPVSVTVGDLDGDTDVDLAIGHQFGDRLTLLLNTGSGTFGLPVTSAGSGQGGPASDFDNDGDLDLAIVDEIDDRVSVLLNDGTGAFTVSHSLIVGWEPFSLVAADLFQSGDCNEPPIADDQGELLDEDTSVVLMLTGTDPEGGDVTFAIVEPPESGTLAETGVHRVVRNRGNTLGTTASLSLVQLGTGRFTVWLTGQAGTTGR